MERARDEGLQLDRDAAAALAAAVGGSQRRILRELEKLALALHPSTRVTLADVTVLAAADTAPGAYDLADAVLAGDLPATLSLAEKLRAHEERPGRLLFPIARRLREVDRAARLLDAGVAEKDAAQALGAPPWLAKKTLAKAKKVDRAALERAICALADLEVELRSGELDEDTAFSLALTHAAGPGD
jgi:DNA polymerase III subunit delta